MWLQLSFLSSDRPLPNSAIYIYGPIGSHTIGTASRLATAGILPPFDRLRMAECQPALIVKWRVQLCGTGPCARPVARYPD